MRLIDAPGVPRSDLHLHTSCSPDSSASPDEMCSAAIRRGMDAIAITDHADFLGDVIRFRGEDCRSYAAYRDIVMRERERHLKDLDVVLGIEVSYRSAGDEEVRSFLGKGRFEFAIGSVHDSPPVNWWDPASARILRDKPDLGRQALEEYYTEIRKAAESGLFSTIGHTDVYERYFPGQWPDIFSDPVLVPVVRSAVQAIAKHSRMEINLTTVHTRGEFAASTLPLLRMYREMGGKPPTVGTDAHSPRWVGADIDAGVKLALAAGFDSVADWREVVSRGRGTTGAPST